MEGTQTAYHNSPNGKRVLVIDPSRIIRTLLTINLQQAGHRVLTVPTSLEGIVSLEALQFVPPEIIFLAMHAQSKDDCRVLHYIQRHQIYSTLPLVLMMTQEDSERSLRSLHRQHAPCLIKPFQICDVLDLVVPPVSKQWEVR